MDKVIKYLHKSTIYDLVDNKVISEKVLIQIIKDGVRDHLIKMNKIRTR